MDWILYIFVCLVVAVPLGYSIIFYLPKKEDEKRNQQKAFELTKAIGNRKIRCVSVKTTYNDKPGRAFYIIEEGAEIDSTKYCTEIAEGWDNSAHTIADARKIANGIIRFMPYSIWIEDLDASRTEFFQPREHNQKMLELEKWKLHDQENMDFYLISDLCDQRMHIERFLHTGTKFKDYWYLLVIETNGENKYLALFDYPVYDDRYARIRLEHFVSYFQKINSGNGSISWDIVEVDQEICDFLGTHPRYTHQSLYKYLNPLSLDSIEPYYEKEYDIF